MAETKECKKCGREFPHKRFSVASVKRGKTYYRNVCITCRRPEHTLVTFDARPTAPMPEPAPIPLTEVYAPGPVFGAFKAPRRILFVPDTHVPYHDKFAWMLMLKAARIFKPDEVVVLGDFADFYSVSAHSKNPNRRNDLKWEVDQARECLKDLQALGATRNIFVCGNHEERLERYLSDRAPALFNSVKVPEILGLTESGWHYYPYREQYKLGKLHITHDTGPCGQNAHRQSSATFQGSAVIGHTHRMELSVMGSADGPPQVAAMFGWLGDFEQVDYLHKTKVKRDWVHGFGIGYHDTGTGAVFLQPIPIFNRMCCVNGEIVRV